MRSARQGIALPVVLGVVVVLSALSALALFDAVQESRVAALAQDRVVARAAALEGISRLWQPLDLALLCLSPPVSAQRATVALPSGARLTVRWRHLGEGLVVAEVEGRGVRDTRHRLRGYLTPDSVERVGGLLRCPAATRLRTAGPGWLGGHPEG
jgi:hypothetical protein